LAPLLLLVPVLLSCLHLILFLLIFLMHAPHGLHQHRYRNFICPCYRPALFFHHVLLVLLVLPALPMLSGSLLSLLALQDAPTSLLRLVPMLMRPISYQLRLMLPLILLLLLLLSRVPSCCLRHPQLLLQKNPFP
jgi:hypothetical protein